MLYLEYDKAKENVMIKGVNKQIIEVYDTGNKYFEKAILFVKPEYMSENEQGLRKEANRLLTEIGNPPIRNKKNASSRKAFQKRRTTTFIFIGTITIACLILSFIITKIF